MIKITFISCAHFTRSTVSARLSGNLKALQRENYLKSIRHSKKELWGGELWSDGYYVATVGEKGNWSIVERYVKNQGKDPKIVQLRLL